MVVYDYDGIRFLQLFPGDSVMKIVQICTNAMSGSVGKIARDINEELGKRGYESTVCYGRGKDYISRGFRIESSFSVISHAIFARLFDSDGLHSIVSTKRLIRFLEEFKPDIIHLHCLHGYYINYPLLVEYIRKARIKVVWTMHDCWAFTGHCAFYDYIGCSKWTKLCFNCPQKHSYPKSLLWDGAKRNYKLKKRLFTSLNSDRIVIVTPSHWLKTELSKSFLNSIECRVIYNDVSDDVFFADSNLKRKKVILGVANVWDRRKGLLDFIGLSQYVPSDYEILIVGASEKQIEYMAKFGVKAIGRTSNSNELAQLYRTSTILFNPTYEDNYPTVNVEAIKCGLPVVTYNSGGSSEIIKRTGMGLVVEKKDYKSVIEYLDVAYTAKPLNNQFDNSMLDEYLNLYNELYKRD